MYCDYITIAQIKNLAVVGVVFYSIGDPLETRYIFAVGKNYGVAAVQPAASNTPPECCFEFFESPSTSEQNKNHAVVGVVFYSIGDPLETRTPDPLLKRQLLYRLS